MKKAKGILLAAFIALFWITWALALNSGGQVAPPGPVAASLTRFPIVESGVDYELVLVIEDFPAGSSVPSHKHGGQMFATVVSGEVVVRDINTVRVVKAGESWTVNAGVYQTVLNGGPEPAKVAMSVLLPLGAELTTQAR